MRIYFEALRSASHALGLHFGSRSLSCPSVEEASCPPPRSPLFSALTACPSRLGRYVSQWKDIDRHLIFTLTAFPPSLPPSSFILSPFCSYLICFHPFSLLLSCHLFSFFFNCAVLAVTLKTCWTSIP